MEITQDIRLVWLPDTVSHCPFCENRLVVREVELDLSGPFSSSWDWTLGRCTACSRWFGLLPDLIEVLYEDGGSFEELDEFFIDGKAVNAGLWIGGMAGVAPWAFIRDQLGSMLSLPFEELPEPEEVRALPVLSATWELGLRPAAWFKDDAGHPAVGHVALVLDPDAGIRGYDLHGAGPHDISALTDLIFAAVAFPEAGPPGRPRSLLVDNAEIAKGLQEALASVAITVRSAPTPHVDEVIDDMVRTVAGPASEPYFARQDEAALKAFFAAARAFYKARPWDRIPGDKFLAFRLGDGPWHYLSVMGQMGEEFGVSLFESWLQLCRFIHNQPTPFDYLMGEGEQRAFEAAGAMEGLTLEPLETLPPEDATLLQALKLKPAAKNLYPFVRRFTLAGLEPPRLPMATYTMLMQAIDEALQKRRASTVTSIKQAVDFEGTALLLRYPAKGDEVFEDQAPGSFRLVAFVTRYGGGRTRLEVDAPGTARLDDVVRAVRKETKDDFYVMEVQEDDHLLWSDGAGRGAPCPRIAHLRGLSNLSLRVFDDLFPLQVMPLTAASGALEVRTTRL